MGNLLTHHDSLGSLTRNDSCSIGKQSPRQLSSVRQSIFRSKEEADEDNQVLKGIKLSTQNIHDVSQADDELIYRKKALSRQQLIKIRQTLIDKCEEVIRKGQW